MKSAAIDKMLAFLTATLGPFSFDVVDHWEGDLVATGIARPSDHSRLVYVLSEPLERFTAILELAPKVGSEIPYADVGKHQRLTLVELAQVVRAHLRIDGVT